jgi:hypothetical protein
MIYTVENTTLKYNLAASKITLNLSNLKILRPKVTKILRICVRSFANPHPVPYVIKSNFKCNFTLLS